MNMFDFDGVVSIGLCPAVGDVVVTGRGFDECEIVYAKLKELLGVSQSVKIPVFFNTKLKSQNRTRLDSARHKVETLSRLLSAGNRIETIFEDDPVQFEYMKKNIDEAFSSPGVPVYWEKPKICFVQCSWIDK